MSKLTDREWCWAALIVALLAMAFSPNGWIGVIGFILVLVLLTG